MEGWIKLHRQICDSSIFDNANLLKFWIWCLCKASHGQRATKVGLETIQLYSGQFVFGRNKASAETGFPPKTCYNYLKQLEQDGMVALYSRNKYTLVCIENWEKFQMSE